MATMPTWKKMYWAGWVVSAPAVLMLLFGAFMKLTGHEQAVSGFKAMGYPENAIIIIGTLELVCTVIYLIPALSVLGAILLTGYLGGAVNAHVNHGGSWLMAVGFGVLLWAGLYLRDRRLRDLLPVRRPPVNPDAA